MLVGKNRKKSVSRAHLPCLSVLTWDIEKRVSKLLKLVFTSTFYFSADGDTRAVVFWTTKSKYSDIHQMFRA